MFKYAITPFLLPPGIFILSLIFVGAWLLFNKKWKAGIANCLLGFLMWSLSMTPISDAMLRGLEFAYSMPKNPNGDVIILLGGGVYDESPDLSGVGAPSEMMLVRIVCAARLHKRLRIPIIVSSGKVFEYKRVEAPIIMRFLVDLGVPPNQVIIEDKSRDTIENARYTHEICERMGYKKPILITSAFHLKRSVMIFEQAGMQVNPFPASFKTWQNKRYGWNHYLPGNFVNAAIAIREYLALLFYKFVH